MRIVMFYHSLLSDWNHGNAHFLRGVATELRSRGHEVWVYEPNHSWSLENLLAEHGDQPLQEFRAAYPGLESRQYDLETLELDSVLEGTDLAIAHEWNDPELIRRIGEHHAHNPDYRLLFHDTHHRCVSEPASLSAYDLAHYDGVLAFGNIVRDFYLARSLTHQAWTWHEAADTHIFHPIPGLACEGDLVWIGNWGDEERTTELEEFLIRPVQQLGLKARVYGVRYPEQAQQALADAGIEYAGWLPNYRVPHVFARFKVTLHVPRRPYVEALPGIPTIRPFEALACGIPLVCAPWEDAEHLFTPGQDFLLASNGVEMQHHLSALLQDEDYAHKIASHGYQTLVTRHTCAHRVDELLEIYQSLIKDKKSTCQGKGQNR